MFLTKIDLDPARRLARKYLGSPQVMHAVVLRATGGDDGDGPGRVLWRADRGPATTTLYLLSPSEPDCTQIVAEAGAAGTRSMTLDYSPFLATLDAGQVWAFRLTANPSYSAPRGPEVRGKRFGHVTVEQQRRWLIERTPRYGFELVPVSGAAVDDAASGDVAAADSTAATGADADAVAASASVVVVRRERPVFGRRNPDRDRRDRVTINRTVYEGVARVTDPDALRHALVAGIGRSKAYGCGLMTLARVRRG